MSSPSSPSSRTYWAPLALLAFALVWRVFKLNLGAADPLPNFAPWMALAFAGAALAPRSWPFWIIPAAMLLIDAVTPASMLWAAPLYVAVVYGCIFLAAMAGQALSGRNLGVLGTLGGTVLCSLGFYVVTNTFSWITDPTYAKTAMGWWQALTIGVPGFPPTWTFLRNALLGDTFFAVLLLIAHNAEAMVRQQPRLPWVGAARA
ncbi:MAG: hypothetical protein KDK97_02635 [Verrucomicrobiales bacterium]|nr:hypothetical protein [Verrucomicrobiales bacterium]MCP5557482.1 hypothetical protein [Verrucomicrobiaceae bacterium]